MANGTRVVVLNDGETYTDIKDCRIMWVPDSVPEEDVDRYVKEHFDSSTYVTEVFGAWVRSIR